MRRIAIVLVVLLALGLVGAAYQSRFATGTANQGAPGARTLAEVDPTTTAPTKSPLRPTPTPSTPDEEIGRALAKLTAKAEVASANARETSAELPKRLRIPSISVDAAVEYVGLASDGSMGVPRDANHVAWYKLGPRPGEVGNAVLAGHVDWGGKTAVFWQLGQLRPGDTVEVIGADDRKYEYVVQWQKWYEASSAPVQDVFGQAGVPEITLISCGGEFDRTSRQYLSRIVVRGILR